MDFEFNEEQKMLKTAAEEVVKKEIDPLLASYPEDKPLPKEGVVKLMRLLKPLGFLGARVPESEGGEGLSYVSGGILWEVIPPGAALAAVNDIIALRICIGGSPELKKRVIPPILAGEKVVGSAISEPNVGSDVRGIETKAVLDGNDYVINGTKIWSSGGSVADILLAIVSLGKDKRGRNLITRLVIERDKSPFQSRDIEMIGLRQHHLAEVVFEDCRVPCQNVVGEPGDAHTALTTSWLSQRAYLGLAGIHLAQRSLDASIAYAKDRKQFGKAIGSFQIIQEKIVEMQMLVEAGRLLAYKALSLLDKGLWPYKETSMAKIFCTEAAIKVTSMAIQIHGALGLSQEGKVEQYFRDARMLTIPDGTTEIQQLIAGRELLGIRAF